MQTATKVRVCADEPAICLAGTIEPHQCVMDAGVAQPLGMSEPDLGHRLLPSLFGLQAGQPLMGANAVVKVTKLVERRLQWGSRLKSKLAHRLLQRSPAFNAPVVPGLVCGPRRCWMPSALSVMRQIALVNIDSLFVRTTPVKPNPAKAKCRWASSVGAHLPGGTSESTACASRRRCWSIL